MASLTGGCGSGGSASGNSGAGGWSAFPTGPERATAIPGCGGRVDPLLARASPRASLAGSFPPSVARGGGTFSGTVTMLAHDALAGVASPAADVLVVREGVVVAEPLPKDAVGTDVDLVAGRTQTFDATGTLRGCAGPAAPPLDPGRYDVYAVVTVTGGAGPGSETVAVGGPWPLDVA